MANDKIITLDSDNFDREVLDSELPVLVDFWAIWCSPCRVVAVVLDELADELDGRVRIAKLDVDTSQSIAQRFDVSSIPTCLMFKNGELVDCMMGPRLKSDFLSFIERNL